MKSTFWKKTAFIFLEGIFNKNVQKNASGSRLSCLKINGEHLFFVSMAQMFSEKKDMSDLDNYRPTWLLPPL